MDAACDANAVRQHSQTLGHAAVIDPNYRADHALAQQRAAEVERCGFINMSDCDDVIYAFRTMVERNNSRLKDAFGGRFVRIRGAVKVKCHLMFGILAPSPPINSSGCSNTPPSPPDPNSTPGVPRKFRCLANFERGSSLNFFRTDSQRLRCDGVSPRRRAR